MATLTDADFNFIRNYVISKPTVRDDLAPMALSKATWKAALQAVEDYMVGGFTVRPATSIKAAIEVVTGATTALRAQRIFESWVAWKLSAVV